MKTNIGKPVVSYVPVATAQFVKTSGALGWVDTDVSATTGTDTTKIWVIVALASSGALVAGARARGETAEAKTAVTYTATFMSKVNSSGHMDLHRSNSGDITYNFIGYIRTGA